ncbi:DUF1853 family protein [Paraburkholderia sp. J12]|uniref:DUF1853 family protein n=1 Tax=Paraburkholderia sp. J12 TaxID=2805432 RepID=UPI002ABE64BE|nr:DUF1853 family protein [Paraburkholderia sp. J12]
MNPAQSVDEAGSWAAGSLDGLTDPAVRDLAWLLSSPSLLRAQPPLAPLATPWALAAEVRATAQWLRELDRDPAPLHEVLDAGRPRQLGRYAELLLAWFLGHGPAARLVAANVPLRQAGVTLGECDFLVEASDGRRLHWELAVKCYLHAGGPGARLADFVGPNLRDRFDRKRAHLLDHQLRLSEREAFLALGHAGPWLAQMFVKGWLFYQAGASAKNGQGEPPELAPDHGRGWWVTHLDWPTFATQQGAAGWSVLPRVAWLAPRRLAAGEPVRMEDEGAVTAAGMRYRATIAAPVDSDVLLEQLARREEPVMVAAFVSDGAGGYLEQSRGFIVPDDWPAHAQAFARD